MGKLKEAYRDYIDLWFDSTDTERSQAEAHYIRSLEEFLYEFSELEEHIVTKRPVTRD